MGSSVVLWLWGAAGSYFTAVYDDQVVKNIRLYVGLDCDYTMHVNSGILIPYGRVSYGTDVSALSLSMWGIVTVLI